MIQILNTALRQQRRLWQQTLSTPSVKRLTTKLKRVRTIENLDFLNLLDVSQLESLLSLHPATASSLMAESQPKDERQTQRERMARKRAAERDLKIPIPKNLTRRLECEQSIELWLRTYFPNDFYEVFTQDRRDMLNSIEAAARYGGDQAIAGPRGEGKTSLAMHGSLFLMVTRICDFPVVIGKSQSKSQLELKDIKEKLQQATIFIEDYPEIGIPFQSVGGWSSRARMQTVAGKSTNIELAADHIAFPTIGIDQLPKNWPAEIVPASCGQVIYSLGIDGPIRGTKFRGKRPKLAIIDDIEDREAAASETLIAKNQEVIEQDIAGLGASAERVARAMLCTIQNRKCNAYIYTDPKKKPSWRGKRYRKMLRPPDRFDMVTQYIDMRRGRDILKDPDAREAFQFWRDNQEDIERGCETSNPQSYSKKLHEDGEPLELSAIQAYYNRVADWGEKAVATEIDNDPPETVGPQGMGLTAEIVSSRISGFDRLQLPANTVSLTAAIDLGKYSCHWVVIAWWKGGGGCVVDYGVAEVKDTDTAMNHEASEPMIYRALLQWRDELLAKEYVDAAGERRKVDCVFIDSGTFTNAAYEFVRQVGPPFFASKGIPNYRPKSQSTDKIKAGDNMHAAYMEASDVWLFELNTDYWKAWMQERFMSPTFDDQNMLRRGALSLFTPPANKRHLSYAQHIVAEELVTEFKEGKGTKTYWNKNNDNNHWLDATYNCCAAGRYTGISLLADPSLPQVVPREVDGDKPKPAKPKRIQHGQKFRTRPGGWVNSLRRR